MQATSVVPQINSMWKFSSNASNAFITIKKLHYSFCCKNEDYLIRIRAEPSLEESAYNESIWF